MNSFDFSKYRRFTEGLFWETEFPPDAEPRWIKVVDAAVLICAIFVFVSIVGWMQHRDAEDQKLIQQEMTAQKEALADRYAKMLGDCMNGGVLWDKASNTAHFCGSVVSVRNP